MIYLIDGHNLIPLMRGLSLQDPDDEEDLIALLQKFARGGGKKIEVYFDRAPAGRARSEKRGMITVHFISERTTADQALMQKIRNLGRSDRAYTVVTSDHRIQAEARAGHVKVVESSLFARQMQAAIDRQQIRRKKDAGLSEDEIQKWIDVFEKRRLF